MNRLRHVFFAGVCASLAGFAACAHDWDQFELGAAATGGAGGQGGGTTSDLTFSCPDVQVAVTPLALLSRGRGAVCVDRFEVSNAQMDDVAGNVVAVTTPSTQPQCGMITLPARPPANPDNAPAQPVTKVTWCEGAAYCQHVGKRLCGDPQGGICATDTSSELYLACSDFGSQGFPYGVTGEASNCTPVVGVPQSVDATTTCERVANGGEKIHFLAGNVQEWEACCDAAGVCNARGGAYNSDNLSYVSCGGVTKEASDFRAGVRGFRCCADVITAEANCNNGVDDDGDGDVDCDDSDCSSRPVCGGAGGSGGVGGT